MPRKDSKSHASLKPIPISTRVRVFWEGDEEWFQGTIAEVNLKRAKCYFVKYDDGEELWEKHEDVQVMTKPTVQKTKREFEVGSHVSVHRRISRHNSSTFTGVITQVDDKKGYRVKSDRGGVTWESADSIQSSSAASKLATRRHRANSDPYPPELLSMRQLRRLSNETNKSVPSRQARNTDRDSVGSSTSSQRGTAIPRKPPRLRKNSASSTSTTCTAIPNKKKIVDDSQTALDWRGIGRQVRVFWDGENEYFIGEIRSADLRKGFLVAYDDGDQAWEPRSSVEFIDGIPQPPSPPSRGKKGPQEEEQTKSRFKRKRRSEVDEELPISNAKMRRAEKPIGRKTRQRKHTTTESETTKHEEPNEVKVEPSKPQMKGKMLSVEEPCWPFENGADAVNWEVDVSVSDLALSESPTVRGCVLRFLPSKGFFILIRESVDEFKATWIKDRHKLQFRCHSPECTENALKEAIVSDDQDLVLNLAKTAQVKFDLELRLGHQKFSFFHAAAFNGHDLVVQNLLREGADVNSTSGSDGSTALILACRGLHVNTVKLLLNVRGVQVDFQNRSKQTALMSCAASGAEQLAKLLLLAGADPNIRGLRQQTAFDLACAKGHLGVVLVLLQQEPAPSLARETLQSVLQALVQSSCKTDGDALMRLVCDAAKDDVLVTAVQLGSPPLVAKALEVGLNPNHRCSEGHLPLAAAICAGSDRLCSLLLDAGAQLDAPAKGMPLIAWAFGRGDLPLSTRERLLDRACLQAGTQRKRKERGRKPAQRHSAVLQAGIMAAVQHAQVELVQAMATRHVDLDVKDVNGWCALKLACMHGNVQMVAALIEAGAEVNHRNVNGESALTWSSFAGRTDVVRLLLRHGAESNVQDKNGLTPLMWAARLGRAAVVELLVGHGASTTITDNEGLSATMWAARCGHQVVGEIIEDTARCETECAKNVNEMTDLPAVQAN